MKNTEGSGVAKGARSPRRDNIQSIHKSRPDPTQGFGTCHSYIVVRRSALSVSFSPNLQGGIFLPIISFQIFILSDYFISYQTVSAAKINHFPSTAIICAGKF